MPKAKKKVVEEVVKAPEKVVEAAPKATKKTVKKVNSLTTVLVCKDENGNGTKPVEGLVSKDGKSITTLDGVTYEI